MEKAKVKKHKDNYPITDSLIQKIRSKGIKDIGLKELLIPLSEEKKEKIKRREIKNIDEISQGYAQAIVLENQKGEKELKRTQLRKIFNEFKNIEKKKDKTEIYKLYYILEYQANRKLISHKFKELLWALLDELEKHFEDTEVTKKIDEFITALVAYIPKE